MSKRKTEQAREPIPAGPGAARARMVRRAKIAGMRTTPSGVKAPSNPGSSPGIESIEGIDRPPDPGLIQTRCLDYSSDRFEPVIVEDLPSFLKQPRAPWIKARWLEVEGLHPFTINALRQHYGFHTLAAEDVLRQGQRPKVESYPDHLFLTVRMLALVDGKLAEEQLALLVYEDTLITLRAGNLDIFEPIRLRFASARSRLRQYGTSYLLYALLDALVDHCFPILERYGDVVEELERQVLENPSPEVQRAIHKVRRELSLFRRIVWPLRDLINFLQREEEFEIPPEVQPYLRDVYDHTVQVMEIVETYREAVGGLNDLYMSAVSNRMNEIMKVLTIMASFFIPITFLAGVYGMNFEHFPELQWKYSYAVFWTVCITVSAALGVFFYRKGWFPGKERPEPGSGAGTTTGGDGGG